MPETESSTKAMSDASDDLILQIAKILKNGINTNPNQSSNTDKVVLSIKLNGENYPLWSRLMRVEIGVRGRTRYINGTTPAPGIDEPGFIRWEQEDLGVFSWILQNIEPNLINNVAEYQSAKALWDALAVTYGTGTDALQVYDLHNQASRQTQGAQTLEQYWNTLQGLWLGIDRRRPNPMKFNEDITAFNKITQEHRLFNFLGGLDSKFDGIRREILRLDNLPSVESAYGMVRKEAARLRILAPATSERTDSTSLGIGTGLVSRRTGDRGQGRGQKGKLDGKQGRPWEDKTKLHCSHCGMSKHTKESCFKLVGFPDWWEDGHKPGKQNITRAVVAMGSQEATGSDDGSHGQREEEIGFAAAGVAGSGGSVTKKDEGNKRGKDKHWTLDCGATDTMSHDRKDIIELGSTQKTQIHTANGGISKVEGAGQTEISPKIKLQCLYVPSLTCKLLSVSQVTRELNCRVLMYSTFCLLQDIHTQEILGRGTERGGLYVVDEVSQHGVARLAHGTPERQLWLWHRRLGHPSSGYLRMLFPSLFSNNTKLPCETCVLAKSHRTSFYSNNTRVDSIFSIIHSDVWGPAPNSPNLGFRYFVLFIDDCTRMTWLYLLKNKSEVSDKFIAFHSMVQTQFRKTIQILRSDNGGEYVNHNLQEFCSRNGIIHQTTCPNTPQQNGVAERKNRTLLEITRALMFESHVPQSYWPEAVTTAVYLTNRLPTKILNYQTPLQTLSSHVSIPSSLTLPPRVFGSTAYVHIHKVDRHKFDPCALKTVFVGYATTQKGYRCYHPPSRRMYITMDCDVVETEYYYTAPLRNQGENSHQEDSLSWLSGPVRPAEPSVIPAEPPVMPTEPLESTHDATDIIETLPDTTPQLDEPETPHEAPVSDVQEVNRSDPSFTGCEINIDDRTTEETGQTEMYVLPPRRNRGIPPKRYSPEHESRSSRYSMGNVVRGSLSTEAKAFTTSLYTEEIPRTVQEANLRKEWRDAMDVEMQALRKNGTWEICNLPLGKRPVGCRWVYTIKHKANGTIERYKARLVAKGYTQTYGIDYSETFSPVAKIDTIRVLFSVAANQGWPLHQFDVKNAFLHGDLKEEVYMEIPPGCIEGYSKNKVCRLRKALYGLKQSPRAWFGRFTMAMKRYGYKQSNSDHTLFIKNRGKLITCLIIYVDDMVITGSDTEEIKQLRKSLFTEFEMKDLGGLKYFLGIEVLRSDAGIFISQRKYVLDLLAETGLVDCKPAETPMMVNHGLQIKEDGKPTNKEQYQRIVGKLIYLAHTRPDIAYAVGVVSQFMHNPQLEHMEAAIRIIRYLKGSPGRGVIFRRNRNLDIYGYTDADWAGNPNDRRSTSGYFTMVGGNLVTWRSKKQKVVALSSAEAEFRGIAKGLTEILWLRKLMAEIGFPHKGACRLLCDNKAAISISENPVQHDRTKHVEVDRHFIKEKLDEGVIELPFVRSEDQLADILTKAVIGRSFNSALSKLGIGDPTIQLEGEC